MLEAADSSTRTCRRLYREVDLLCGKQRRFALLASIFYMIALRVRFDLYSDAFSSRRAFPTAYDAVLPPVQRVTEVTQHAGEDLVVLLLFILSLHLAISVAAIMRKQNG